MKETNNYYAHCETEYFTNAFPLDLIFTRFIPNLLYIILSCQGFTRFQRLKNFELYFIQLSFIIRNSISSLTMFAIKDRVHCNFQCLQNPKYGRNYVSELTLCTLEKTFPLIIGKLESRILLVIKVFAIVWSPSTCAGRQFRRESFLFHDVFKQTLHGRTM